MIEIFEKNEEEEKLLKSCCLGVNKSKKFIRTLHSNKGNVLNNFFFKIDLVMD